MRKRVRWPGLGALAVLVAATAVASASAHALYEQATSRGPTICVGTGTSFAEGPAAGGGQAFVEGWWQSYAGGSVGVCLSAKNMDPYNAVVRRELWRWDGYQWALCATNGWLYNEVATSYMYRSQQWSPVPCGRGTYHYYGNYGLSYGWSNGQWHGPGWVWSGSHQIS